MSTNEELIQAAKLLKENCAGRECDKNCPFFTSVEEFEHERTCCSFGFRSNPLAWEIPKPRRWTDTDILWAKAAKASGLVKIYKGLDSMAASGSAPGVDSCEFPWGAFKALKHDETVLIDSILREVEE